MQGNPKAEWEEAQEGLGSLQVLTWSCYLVVFSFLIRQFELSALHALHFTFVRKEGL